MVQISELKELETFESFSDDQLEEIAGIAGRRSLETGQMLYQRGDRATHLYVVLRGLVALREMKPGDQVGIGFESRSRGELFGTASVMQPREYTLSAVCLEDTEVLAVEARKLLDACDRHPELGYKLMRRIAEVYFDRYRSAKRQLYQMLKAPTLITALPG